MAHSLVPQRLRTTVNAISKKKSDENAGFSFVASLKACAQKKDLREGMKVHDEILKQDVLTNFFVASALVTMYVKCDSLLKAREVLEHLPVWNVVTWNALLTGYAREKGHGEEALNCFERMQREGICPNAVTFVSVLKACGSTGAVAKGKQLHAEIKRRGLLKDNVVLGGALVDMYILCGAIATAREVFMSLPVRNIISWSVLIAGYAQLENHSVEALECFEQMQREGHTPDAVTFVCIFKACGSIGALDKGMEIHAEVHRQRLLRENVVLGSALVDMYVKCGALDKAREVLLSLPLRNVVTWSSLIAGYAHHGCIHEALECFEQMQSNGFSPDAVVYVCVLNACSHSGLVHLGEKYFASMSALFDIKTNLGYHICMVDLFGRAGCFDKAVKVIGNAPLSEQCVMWTALLGACQKWGNVKFGRWAYDHEVHQDERNSGTYVCMSNIYAAADVETGAKAD